MITLPNPSQQLADDLAAIGLDRVATVHRNLTMVELMEHAVRNGEGRLGPDGQMIVETGKHTGRSPKDKFFVKEPGSEQHIDWGTTNKPIGAGQIRRAARTRRRLPRRQRRLRSRLLRRRRSALPPTGPRDHDVGLAESVLARPVHRAQATGDDFKPEFTVLDAALFEADPERDGTRTETFCLVNFARKMVLIGGTRYAGEIKKSVFTLMNYLMPLRGVFPMHASANVGPKGDVAIFFGLSGHRQDDAVLRSHAPADRRRRTRLVGRRRLQLRRRLLREDHQPLANGRTRNLGRRAPFRDRARKRRHRPGHAQARPRFGRTHREHARSVPDRVHPERRPRFDGRQREDDHHADRRRVRRTARDLAR